MQQCLRGVALTALTVTLALLAQPALSESATSEPALSEPASTYSEQSSPPGSGSEPKADTLNEPSAAEANSPTDNRLSVDSPDVITVDALLKNAAIALRQENYQGRFTYEFGSVLETLEVTHAVVDGVEHERILHLSGKKREFLRDGRSEDCLTAGSMLLRGANLNFNGRAQKLADNYHFYIGADDRIAGREASVVQVVPRDEYRYGMTYAFDKASGLPLLTLTGTAQNTLERFQFVQLDVGAPIAEDAFEAEDGPYKLLSGGDVQCITGDQVPDQPSGWRAGWLPNGFVLSQSSSDEQHQAVLTYTDGLASFTLFVRPLAGQAGQGFKAGVARRGATIALLHTLQAGQELLGVVLVGEVPLQTARQVVASLSYKP